MRIRQIAFVAHDLARSRELINTLLKPAPPFRDPGVAEFGLDNAVYTFGDQFIEVVSPTRDNTAGGRHLQRHGDSGYMLLLQTTDLRRDRERFAKLGVRSIWNSDHDDISATHLHPKDVGAAIVSVDEPRPAPSWRWGGPTWRVQPGEDGRQRVRGLTLRARDPQAMAQRWAELFERPQPTRRGDAWRVDLIDGFADFIASGADSNGSDGIAGFTLAVVDPPAMLSRARDLGLPTTDSSVVLLGARLDLIPV